MKKLLFPLIVLMMLVAGCVDNTPAKHPQFQNFDIVKITLSGDKAQVVNNKVEFDRKRNCWLVQVKMEKQSVVGRMARKLLGNADIKNGLLTQTLFENELELWRDK